MAEEGGSVEIEALLHSGEEEGAAAFEVELNDGYHVRAEAVHPLDTMRERRGWGEHRGDIEELAWVGGKGAGNRMLALQVSASSLSYLEQSAPQHGSVPHTGLIRGFVPQPGKLKTQIYPQFHHPLSPHRRCPSFDQHTAVLP